MKADNIISMNDDDNLDSEYFRQIIEEKLDAASGSYLQTLAMKQMGSDFDAEGKFATFVLIYVGVQRNYKMLWMRLRKTRRTLR